MSKLFLFCPVLLVGATLRKTESDPVVFMTAPPTVIPVGNTRGEIILSALTV